jgi:hypothetical protein
MPTFRLHHWPANVEETWDQVGDPVKASSVEEAFEKIGPTDAGRYFVTVDESMDHGGYYRLEPDGTIARRLRGHLARCRSE